MYHRTITKEMFYEKMHSRPMHSRPHFLSKRIYTKVWFVAFMAKV